MGYSPGEFTKPRFYGIIVNVLSVLLEALLVKHLYFGESPLPDLTTKAEFPICTDRKIAFNELHRFLNARAGGDSDEDVHMIKA